MAVGARPNVRGGEAWPVPVSQRLQEGEGPLGNSMGSGRNFRVAGLARPRKVSGSGYAPSPERADDERHDEQDEEDDEKELRDARSRAGDTAEAKQSSDDRQYEKCQCPTEHVCLHFLCPTIQAAYEDTTPLIW